MIRQERPADHRRTPSIMIAIMAMTTMVVTMSFTQAAAQSSYGELTAIFEEWRAFEKPVLVDGAPDYSKRAIKAKHKGLKALQQKLAAIDTNGWPIEQKVDHRLIKAEMNGLDFYIRVLEPWARDPAFYEQVWTYQSDTPAHEGPTNHALIELWTYDFPLSEDAAQKLTAELKTVAPFLLSARENLTGNARDLWMASIYSVGHQVDALEALAETVGDSDSALSTAIEEATEATKGFIAWLENEAPNKTGPSGIGKENYTWHLQNVHLVPLTWEDEVMLLKRELKRAHASLRLEEHRNRNLPEIPVAETPEDYEALALSSVDKYMTFLDENDVLTIKNYLKPALVERIGVFAPADNRNFFAQATHREPMTLWTHFYHWWDLARMENEPHESPVRRGPLLYNIFDSRAEGVATAMEEMMLHAGLYDDNPRAREIVWIMQAQRAARGLASLYAHANEFTMKDASDFHVKWTPRGWMSPDLELLGFEQQLYLRQPGYGTSYVTGKHLVEELLADRSRQVIDGQDKNYALSDFFAEMDDVGVIPVSLIRWELTGDDSAVQAIDGK